MPNKPNKKSRPHSSLFIRPIRRIRLILALTSHLYFSYDIPFWHYTFAREYHQLQ